jgi:ClpX C4-type zinc finger
MVIAISGRCSFCGKSASEVFGLAGVTNRSVRVCNECIDICLEILKDDLYAPTVGAPPPPSEPVVSRETSELFDFEEIVLAHNVGLPRTEDELEDFMERVREILDQSETDRPRTTVGEQSCSFCDWKQNEPRKLIVGSPSMTYICDICIGDAAALVSLHC